MIGRVNGGGVNIDFVTATADTILYPYVGADQDGEPVEGTIPTKAAQTYDVSTTDQTISAVQYLGGNQVFRGVAVSGVDATKMLTTATVKVGDAANATRITNVTGTIPTKTSSDLSASGKTVTVPGGYYASQYTKDVALGTITGSGSVAQSAPTFSLSGTTVTASVAAKTGTITPSVTTAGYVSSSEGTKTNGTFSLTANSSTYTIPTETKTVTPTTSAQTVSRSTNTFMTSVTVNAIPNQVAGGDVKLTSSTLSSTRGGSVWLTSQHKVYADLYDGG